MNAQPVSPETTGVFNRKSCRDIRVAGKGVCPTPVPDHFLAAKAAKKPTFLQIRFFSLLTTSSSPSRLCLSPATTNNAKVSKIFMSLAFSFLYTVGFPGDDLYNRITRVFDFFPKG